MPNSTRFNEPSWTSTRFGVIDLEGNGGQPPDLVELAVIPIDSGVPGRVRSWLVQPETRISSRVSRIHGISNADVASAPKFAAVSAEIATSLEGRYLVAHHAPVDWGVLGRKLPQLRPAGVLDTLRLARKLCPGLESYSLSKLLVTLELEDSMSDVSGRPHRAAYDAAGALELFMFLVARTPRGTLSLRDLCALCELPAKRDDPQRSLF